MLKIRKLTKKDDKNLFVLVRQLSNNFDDDITYDEFDESLKMMRKNGYFLIGAFNEDKKMISVCGIWINSRFWCGKYMEIDNFIVDQNSRSSGIGKIMLDHIVKIAQDAKVNIIFLAVYKTNELANKFYKRYGFEDVGNFLKLKIT